MGRKIDEETIRKINEVYLVCGVKTKTAQIVGVSVSTVSKYIDPNYKPKEKKPLIFPCVDKINGCGAFIDFINNQEDKAKAFADYCILSKDELAQIEEIQKGLDI